MMSGACANAGWEGLREGILQRLKAGTYRLAPVRMIDKREGKRFESWESEDAIVLKMLQLTLKPVLTEKLSQHCYNVAGRGGHQGAVRAMAKGVATGKYKFVMRTDVRGYYANIHHTRLLEQLRGYVDDPQLLELVSQYCHRTTVHRGLYKFTERGIPLGCSLSPLMGALYLDLLDKRLEKLPGIEFARFQDDVVILAETRWKLRRAIKVLNETFAELGVEQHPDKTSIGRVERGFDFLGVHFALQDSEEVSESLNQNQNQTNTNKQLSLTPARSAIRRMAEKITRLYEQRASTARVDDYVGLWVSGCYRRLHHQPLRPPEIKPTENDDETSTEHPRSTFCGPTYLGVVSLFQG